MVKKFYSLYNKKLDKYYSPHWTTWKKVGKLYTSLSYVKRLIPWVTLSKRPYERDRNCELEDLEIVEYELKEVDRIRFGNIDMCSCGINKATEPHTCPYKSDINDDKETLCTCCEECEQECAWEI